MTADSSSVSQRHRIELRGVSSGYHGKPVLEDVSFVVEEPAIYVVLGPNGAGKTTLFRTLAGILSPYSGTVEIDGIDIARREARTRLQYLSHIDGIPDALRVEEALRFYAGVQGATPEDVERVVRLLGIEELRHRYFAELSQGQKKRVSIARVFLQERGIYLLDEPTSNLDPKLAREIRDLVLGLSRDDLVLYSSHNLFEAKEIGKYVLALRNGKVGYFGRLSDLRPARYVIGIRAEGAEGILAASTRKGDYYLQELAGPEEVPKLVAELAAKGVRIREVKEMENPLEDLFA
ncbi:MAG: heme ABC exporter ATP-binding protein CcmA [Thermoplasmata archaeon]|nr:heme ABC exporter ATP-binding protein CcmA [Thermoplasmata archaeon]MCI4356299.1 heme ABC exporter ATP-binding protein CcmA [Thermoplasmata archaeon]